MQSKRPKIVPDMQGLLSGAHRPSAELTPPLGVWRSLRLQLEKEVIVNARAGRSVARVQSTPLWKYERFPREAATPEEDLQCSEVKFRAVVESIACAIFISRGERLSYVNHAAEIITGYTRKELLGMCFLDLLPADGLEGPAKRGWSEAEETEAVSQREVRISTKNHEERWLDITITPINSEAGPSRLISGFDVTERKGVEAQSQLLAITDPLTGLCNYRRLIDVLHTEIERSERTLRPFAILLLDLDGLKKVNDCYGHLVGSRALFRIGDVLRRSCRAIDTAARYGGDEFAVVLPETAGNAAEFVASRIHELIATETEHPALSASIGVAIYPSDGRTVQALLQKADRELYRTKSHHVEQPCLLVAT